MKKYFTKEYIKECDCEEIQKLKTLTYYDNWQYLGGKNKWLATGDQLDEEIVKICKRKYTNIKWEYMVSYGYDVCLLAVQNWVSVRENFGAGDSKYFYGKSDKNPLIAKIKLLKELLNDN